MLSNCESFVIGRHSGKSSHLQNSLVHSEEHPDRTE